MSELVGAWRAGGLSVAVLAVDPSSRRSGGSLLGDRARIAFDPADERVFIRSTAAAGRLGGLAPATREAAAALATAFDVVVVETVGVGQSETDVAEVADTVAVVVQPASGDTLQFLKSGIMEIPDVLVVTKSDLGEVALRARRDLSAALRSVGDRETPVVAVSSLAPARASTSSSRRSPRTASGSTCPRAASPPAAPPRSRTSRPSTVSRDSARWAGGRAAERRLDEADPGADVPSLVELLALEAASA